MIELIVDLPFERFAVWDGVKKSQITRMSMHLYHLQPIFPSAPGPLNQLS